MRRSPFHTFIARLLIVALLTLAVSGMHGFCHDDHALAGDATVAQSHAPQSPDGPTQDHQDADGCDSCLNCACHAPFVVQSLHLSYNPVILELITFDPFTQLPEVWLPKFIPPQILA